MQRGRVRARGAVRRSDCPPGRFLTGCRGRHAIGYALLLLLVLQSLPVYGSEPLIVDKDRRKIRISATVDPGAFQGLWTRLTGIPGYHLLVWHQGRAASSALFVTSISDVIFHEAMVEIGAVPGNALGMTTWEDRENPDSDAPDRVIEGTPVDISVTWDGLDGPIPISEILDDPGGKGFDFRFGGHLDNVPIWRSGCVVCLYSCPGSKIGNATYTVRDYVNDTTVFRVRDGVLPAPGSHVWLIFTLRDTIRDAN